MGTMPEETVNMDYAVDEGGNVMPVAEAEILFDGEESIEPIIGGERRADSCSFLIDLTRNTIICQILLIICQL